MMRIHSRLLVIAAVATASTTAVAAPTTMSLGNGLTARFPASWPVVREAGGTLRAVHKTSTKKKFDAVMHVRVETHKTHADALARLGQMEEDHSGNGEPKSIGGWPGFERRVRVPRIVPGEAEAAAASSSAATVWHATTAVVVDLRVVAFETTFEPEAADAITDEALAIGRDLRLPAAPATAAIDLQQIEAGAFQPRMERPRIFAPPARPNGPKPFFLPSAAVRLPSGAGEIEVAAASNGKNVAIASACNILFSTNFGATFTQVTTPAVGWPLDGDCGVTWGNSGAFYISQLGGGTSPDTQPSPQTITVFPFPTSGQSAKPPQVQAPAAPAVDLRALTDRSKYNIDQPRLVADPWNLSKQNLDRLYLVWQGESSFTPYITCSTDAGATWRTPKALKPTASASYPRVAVAPNGLVYVLATTSKSAVAFDLFILSSCDDGLNPTSDSERWWWFSPVACPVPGLDRCNNGNVLSSPTVAVDGNGVVYVAFAAADGKGGENITVWPSRSGGAEFSGADAVNLNSAASARRFLPWLTTWNGSVYAGWYDRRTSTANQNDLTRYFIGSASWVGNQLVPAPDVDISRVDDSECSSGFPNGVRALADCTSCKASPGVACPTTTGSGAPKYGDYNTIAAGGNRLFTSWASATSPAGLPAPSSIAAYSVAASLCPGTTPACGSACCGASQTCMSNLCCEKGNICPDATGARVCCAPPFSCGGGGKAGVCGCTPASPAVACAGDLHPLCGQARDGCGGLVTCPTCPAQLVCFDGQCLDRRCVPRKCPPKMHFDPDECQCLPGLPH